MNILFKNKPIFFQKNTLLKKLISFRSFLRGWKYHHKYRRITSGKDSLKNLEVISVEFCSICNLRCRYCFLEKKQRPSFLDIDVYKKLLFEICQNKEYQIKIMEWPISGCFFLHPKYKEIIQMTKESQGKYPNFRPWIILNDNMMLFDKDTVDFVLGEGVVNQIICSIDGVDQESFAEMRPHADFNKVLENTKYLMDINKRSKKKIIIQINNGRDSGCLGRKLSSQLAGIFKQADLMTYWEPLDWNESFHKKVPSYVPGASFCSFVFESVALSTSGYILKCCMDLKEATKYADFKKSTLEEIWFSDTRKAFLKEMYAGDRESIPGCSCCSISYVSQNKHF